MSNPRIAVLGTGANGASIGADLTRAGHDVTFIEQWPDHVEAMRANGIRVQMPDETQTTPVDVIHLCEVATLREPFDLVFVVMKAYDTRWACELIRPLVKANGLVVGLQNGMTIDEMADVVGRERTVGAVIEVTSNMFDPGVVNRQTPPSRSWFALGSLDGNHNEELDQAADILRAAGTVEMSDDIRSSKWMKLVVNAAELVPSALLDMPLRDAIEVGGMVEFMHRCGKEALEACIASGSRVVSILGVPPANPDEEEAFAEALLETVVGDYASPDTRTTVLQDWMKGRRAEANEVNGLVVDELKKVGRAAPANELVVELARRVESGDLSIGRRNAELMAGARN